MDGNPTSISSSDLYARLGTASAPVLVDVRRQEAFAADDRLIVGALHVPPEDMERLAKGLPDRRPVVAYCAHGHDVSQGAAAALRKAGFQATYLHGGIAGWGEARLPPPRKRNAAENKQGTRRHPELGPLYCP